MNVCLFADARSIHTRRLALGLAERGVVVHIVCHKPADVPGASVERFRVPRSGLIHPHRYPKRLALYLRDFLRRFDVVNVHFLQDWGFLPEIMAEGTFVASPWGSDVIPPPGEEAPTRELTAARRMMLRQAAAVTAWGNAFARSVAQFAGIAEKVVQRTPLGVDLDLFQPPEGTVRARRDGFHIGFFKGFREVYGAAYLMEAVPAVLSEFPSARFTFIGDGPQRDSCRELAVELSVDHAVTWLPHQPHECLPALLANWDLTVIPSICESFCAAALEASAMGIPVVAANVGGLPETVRDGETGLLVPPRSSQALAEAVIRLLRDERLRLRMGSAGRALVQREYSWQACLDCWPRTYEMARETRHQPA